MIMRGMRPTQAVLWVQFHHCLGSKHIFQRIKRLSKYRPCKKGGAGEGVRNCDRAQLKKKKKEYITYNTIAAYRENRGQKKMLAAEYNTENIQIV